MYTINVRNVHAALPEGLRLLAVQDNWQESRNGRVTLAKGPVTTTYRHPDERVIFWPLRDANPFFHFFESLWMLNGQDDVNTVAEFAGNMANYSDDGLTLHGAYGHRWRQFFGFDQLGMIIEALKANPQDRRQVLQMWSAPDDLGRDGRDLPCNTQAYFGIDTDGRLDMTVCCRSNDIIWGAYGANAVHFSMMQEYVAAGIGCPVGQYHQMSNNFHAYDELFQKMAPLVDEAGSPFKVRPCPYIEGKVWPHRLVSVDDIKVWQQDLAMFMSEGDGAIGYRDPFFRKVAMPLLKAHRAYKSGNAPTKYVEAMNELEKCQATDWKLACEEWVIRRYKKWESR
jgi:thymidylate synthase